MTLRTPQNSLKKFTFHWRRSEDKSLKIYDKQWVLTLLLLPFFKLQVFENISSLHILDTLFDVGKIISFGIIIVLYLNGRRLSRMLACIILYQLTLLFSTAMNDGNYWKLAVSCGTVISFCMITELSVKKNSRLYFKTVLDIYIPLSVINLLTILLFPDGIAREDYYGNIYYLLGIRNGLPSLLIPLLIYAFVYSGISGRKFTGKVFFFTAVVSATILITWSATGVAGLVIFLLFVFFIYGKKSAVLFDSLNLSVIYVAAFLCIIVFRLQSAFSFIIEDLLHKSISFTGRTDIWDIAIMLIKRSPIIGYGVYEGHGLIFIRGQYYYAHNAVLEVLLQGGAVSLVFYVLIFAVSAVSLYKCRRLRVSQMLSFGIFTVIVMMLMEAYSNIWIFVLPVIACCVPEIAEQSEKTEEESAEDIPLSKRYIHYRLNRR